MNTALITGGSGYLGSHLAKKLFLSGWQVVIFDIKKPSHSYLHKFYMGDIRNKFSLCEVLSKQRFDVIYHFAGLIEVGESMNNPTEYWDVNVGGTVSLLSCMKRFNQNRIIFSSTAGLYVSGNIPIVERETTTNNSVYANTKNVCERAIEDSGFEYVIFRYFNIAGADHDCELGENHKPETHLIPSIFNNLDNFSIYGDDYNTPDGTCIRDYVHVSDVVDAHISSYEYLKEGNESIIMNLGTGKGNSILEIIDIIKEILCVEVHYTYRDRRSGDPDSLVANIDLAKEIIKYEPKYDIRAIIETAYAWHKKQTSRIE